MWHGAGGGKQENRPGAQLCKAGWEWGDGGGARTRGWGLASVESSPWNPPTLSACGKQTQSEAWLLQGPHVHRRLEHGQSPSSMILVQLPGWFILEGTGAQAAQALWSPQLNAGWDEGAGSPKSPEAVSTWPSPGGCSVSGWLWPPWLGNVSGFPWLCPPLCATRPSSAGPCLLLGPGHTHTLPNPAARGLPVLSWGHGGHSCTSMRKWMVTLGRGLTLTLIPTGFVCLSRSCWTW